MLGNIGISGESADANTAAVRQFFDLRKRQTVDVDELRRPLNTHFHEVDQVRAAREKLRARVRCAGLCRLLRVSRARISERIHVLFPAASLIASTIFGYAPQRQRLPLIHSRISSSLFTCPSLMQATAEQICPGVQ